MALLESWDQRGRGTYFHLAHKLDFVMFLTVLGMPEVSTHATMALSSPQVMDIKYVEIWKDGRGAWRGSMTVVSQMPPSKRVVMAAPSPASQ